MLSVINKENCIFCFINNPPFLFRKLTTPLFFSAGHEHEDLAIEASASDRVENQDLKIFGRLHLRHLRYLG